MSDELVLCVPAERLRVLGAFAGFTTDVGRYLPALLDSTHLQFRPRAVTETDPTWLQLIPYVVLLQARRVFCYTRGNTGGEQRLRARKSVGIGGHINPVDADGGDPYRAGLHRELQEEVELPSVVDERVLGLVFDPVTPVGQVHLGIVHALTLANDIVRSRDANVTECGFVTMAQLRADVDALESWSRLTIDHLTLTDAA